MSEERYPPEKVVELWKAGKSVAEIAKFFRGTKNGIRASLMRNVPSFHKDIAERKAQAKAARQADRANHPKKERKKHKNGKWPISGHGNKATKVVVGQLKRMMTTLKDVEVGTTGWPDLYIIADDKPMFIEVKQKGDFLSDAQKRCHRALELAGVVVMVLDPSMLELFAKGFRDKADALHAVIGRKNKQEMDDAERAVNGKESYRASAQHGPN